MGEEQQSAEQMQSRLSGQDRVINEMNQAKAAQQAKLAEAGYGTFEDMLAAAGAQSAAPGREGRISAAGVEGAPDPQAPLVIDPESFRTAEGEIDIGKIVETASDHAVTKFQADQKKRARASEVDAIDQAAQSEAFAPFRGEAGDNTSIAAMIEEEAMRLSPQGPANAAQVALAAERARANLERMTTNRLASMDAAARANLNNEPPGPGATGQAGSANEAPPPTPPEEMDAGQLQAHAQSEAAGMLRARQANRQQEAGQRA